MAPGGRPSSAQPYIRYGLGGKGRPARKAPEFLRNFEPFRNRLAIAGRIGCPASERVLHLRRPARAESPDDLSKKAAPLSNRSRNIVFALVLAILALGMYVGIMIKTGLF